jgi:hypothetical protein
MMRRAALLLGGFVVATLILLRGTPVRGEPVKVTLILTRQLRNAYGLWGKLQVEGQSPTEFICYTLERNTGAIPEGTYDSNLRYETNDNFKGQAPTPSKPYVRLKAGKTQADADGWILIGAKFVAEDVGGKKKTTGLAGGREASEKLKAILYPEHPSSFGDVRAMVKIVKSPTFRDHDNH